MLTSIYSSQFPTDFQNELIIFWWCQHFERKAKPLLVIYFANCEISWLHSDKLLVYMRLIINQFENHSTSKQFEYIGQATDQASIVPSKIIEFRHMVDILNVHNSSMLRQSPHISISFIMRVGAQIIDEFRVVVCPLLIRHYQADESIYLGIRWVDIFNTDAICEHSHCI